MVSFSIAVSSLVKGWQQRIKDVGLEEIYMDNSKRQLWWRRGALAGAILALGLWLIPHPPYNFFVALAISLLPLTLGLLGNYVQHKYFNQEKEK